MATVRKEQPDLDETAILLEHERACDEQDEDEYRRWCRGHRSDLVLLTGPQRRFLELPDQVGLFWGGVRVGKSTVECMDMALYHEHRHPRQEHHREIVQLMAGRSWSQMVDLLRTAWQFLNPRDFHGKLDLSTGSVKGQRHPILTGTSGPGKGSQIRIGTFEQGPLSIQGWTLHRIPAMDEPPPEAYYIEARSRLISTGGCLRMGFCPNPTTIGKKLDSLDWLWNLVDAGQIGLVHAPLTQENCTPAEGVIRVPHLYQSDIDAYAATIPPLWRQMMLGATRHPERTGRLWDVWGPHLIQADPIPRGETWNLGIGCDWGDQPGKRRISLVAVRPHSYGHPQRVHVYRHYQADGGTDHDGDARAIQSMLADIGCTFDSVDFWRGDRAHHASSGAIQSNKRLLKAIARLLGHPDSGPRWTDKLPRPLARMWTPQKWFGSPYDNAEGIYKLMNDKGYTVDPSCLALIDDHEHQQSMHQTDPHKDGPDSVFYAAIPMLDRGWHRPT